MLTTAVRPPRPTQMVLACYVAFAALGWFLNGFGAILPELEQDVGGWANVYPLLPGAVMLVWGLIGLRRRRGDGPRSSQAAAVIGGSIAMAVGLVVMGITRWVPVSLIGALCASISVAYLVRLLPAVLATLRAGDTERVIMRSNAYSSVAAVVAPLAVGLSIAVGTGWLPGMAIPICIAAVAVTIAARSSLSTPPAVQPADQAAEVVPPLRVWWREFTVLAVSIMIEFCFVYFAATFLHDELELSTAAAAAGAGAWGIGMAAGRFALSTWPPPRTVLPSAALIAFGFALLWGVPSAAVAIAGICIAGLGASPLYPSRLTALIDRFPASPHEGSARGSLASGAALTAAPALMAGVRAVSNVRVAYLAVPVLIVILVGLTRGQRTASRLPSLSS